MRQPFEFNKPRPGLDPGPLRATAGRPRLGGRGGVGRMAGAVLASMLIAVPGLALGQTAAERLNDFPTAARADYVFACMSTNGMTREMLQKCSCSVDEVAQLLSYEEYLQAETVLSMRRVGGERMAVFNSSAAAANLVAELRRAQAEAEIVCF